MSDRHWQSRSWARNALTASALVVAGAAAVAGCGGSSSQSSSASATTQASSSASASTVSGAGFVGVVTMVDPDASLTGVKDPAKAAYSHANQSLTQS